LSEDGKWYLPYQPHATVQQFENAFLQADKYFEVKNRLDPSHRFTNKLLDKYNPFIRETIEKKRDSIKGYYRDEGQSFLTVPEWYLVFNPKEYADYLEEGRNPSDFPFYASIDEYWTLYDRSMKLVSHSYEENEEYNTMLQVIGVSVTLEYTAKMLYENTIGRIFSWFSNGTISDEEKVIIEAQRAYSNFIYDVAWYEFEFIPWVNKVWAVSNTAESNWLRKIERTLFFTLEFTFKAGYAALIEWAAKASYEEPVTDIYMLISNSDSLKTSQDIKIIKETGDKKIISIPRWGTFTKSILELCDTEMDIVEVGGNDEILVSVITDTSDNIDSNNEALLYKSRIVTAPDRERRVYLLSVNKLLSFVRDSKYRNIEVEHIYDY
jgi:hypothetical protein